MAQLDRFSPFDRSTLVEVLRLQAAKQPDRWAFTFLHSGEVEEARWTYADLDRRARTIGAALQQHGAAGERVLLVYPPGLEYVAGFMGCLYAGAIAVPVYPPDPLRLDRTLPRLAAIMQDARPSTALTLSPFLMIAQSLFTRSPELQCAQWIATDALRDETAGQWREPGVTCESLALLQYTSGSTATPKGVMLTHGNLLHNSRIIYHAFDHTAESRGVIWLPPYHDMGLTGGILQPLYGGFPVVLMSPLDFLQKPFRWLQAISKYRATTSGGPNFAYDLCVRKVTLKQREPLDLSCWQVAFNGSEPVRAETLERFAAMFAPCGFKRAAFYPCYGLAEATLIVSGGAHDALPVSLTVRGDALEAHQVINASAGEPGARTLVGCGSTLLDQEITAVSTKTLTRCAPDQVGEIWVRGPSVAQGYWRRPTETQQTFQAHLAEIGQGLFLRTGDLGFMKDGELFVTGRLKDMIIIEGRNLYPQDIEAAVEASHPAFRPGCCAAFAVDVASKERLVVVAEVDHRRSSAQGTALTPQEMIKAARRAISEQHEVMTHDLVLLQSGSIPKTSSGKLQRHACRAGYLAGSLEPWTG
jgi:acyl-CoA synthetase (AMP-forming)/AMP-acid ligase II